MCGTGVPSRRFVFIHPSGLHQIAGELSTDTIPARIAGPFTMMSETYAGALLKQVTPRAVYYRAEVDVPK